MATGEPKARGDAWREGDDDDARSAARGYLLARLLVGPVAAAYVLRADHDLPAAFWIVFAVAMVGSVAAVGVVWSPRWRSLRLEYTIPADVTVLVLLMALSGGAQSELRDLVIAMMIAPAIVMTPRVVAATGAGVLLGYLAVALPDVLQDEPHAGGEVLAYGLGLVWATGTAVILSSLRVAVNVRVSTLLRGRRVLLGGVLDLEARERRRFTKDIHEGPLQFLLAARQDLQEAREGDRSGIDRAEAGVLASIDELRDVIAGVHPVALDHGGLAAALRAVADRASNQGGFQAAVVVDPAAEGMRDDVLVNVARELIANTTDHAGASALTVTVALEPGVIVLEVADDGVGFQPDTVRSNAVGLAACAERVAAADGAFALHSAPGAGTRVRVELPPPVRAARRVRG